MVWSGYAVLMSGKTDSIKVNNNPGCLPGSTFVYSEVFKLDFSLASTHLKSLSLLHSALGLDSVLGSVTYLRTMIETKGRGILGLAAAGPAELRRCWHRQSSAWCVSGMLQVSSPGRSHRMLEISSTSLQKLCHT
ncbi:hypothetical protein Tco_0831603 [Tanacetum coccineum]